MCIHNCLLLPFCRWLQHVHLAVHSGINAANVSWSAFHASRLDLGSTKDTTVGICRLLPLFQEDAATVAMVRHSLDVIKKVVDITNKGQTPIVAVDQPLFGGLHIELAAYRVSCYESTRRKDISIGPGRSCNCWHCRCFTASAYIKN